MQGVNLMVSQTLSNRGQDQTEFTFNNNSYIFPNNIDFCKQFKSCVTILQIPSKQLSEAQYKKLSLINKSRFIIKLKQIKKQIQDDEDSNQPTQYKLYYEVIPFSLIFVKTNEHNLKIRNINMEKVLKDIVADLIQINIYYDLRVQSCGFTESGQFKIFIPPTQFINQKKLSSSQKIKLNTACLSILKFWQKQHPKTQNQYIIKTITSNGQINLNHYKEKIYTNQDDQQNGLKKTIKLSKSKNYSKQINKAQDKSNINNKYQQVNTHNSNNNANKIKQKQITNDLFSNSQKQKNITNKNLKIYKESASIVPKQPSIKNKQTPAAIAAQKQKSQLKKYKSQQILNISNKDSKNVTKVTYKSKINQINQKLNNIKSTLIPKKIIPFPHQQSDKWKITNQNNRRQDFFNDNYHQDIIYQCKPNHLQVQNQQNSQGQSFDTYLDEIGSQYKMPNFNSTNLLRNTASPAQFLLLKNALKPKEGNNKSWKHESAGNSKFKTIIKKNQQLYPQLMQQNYSTKSKNQQKVIAKPALKKQSQNKMLKKMTSLQTFDSKMQTISIHLSQFSKDLANNRRKRQKQQKNIQLKQKVQDILMKSKKAIQLLKSPHKIKLNSYH